jgi:hypothetical protein
MTGAQRQSLAWLAVLGLLGLLIYWPGLRAGYYADDFQWYFDPPPSSVLHFFAHPNPVIGNAYRPLQAAFLAAVQREFGRDTLAIHLVSDRAPRGDGGADLLVDDRTPVQPDASRDSPPARRTAQPAPPKRDADRSDLVAAGVYALARTMAGVSGPGVEGGRYGFNLGLNLLVNIGLMGFAALLPISSVAAFSAIQHPELLALLAIGLAWASVALVMVWGIGTSDRSGLLTLVAGLAVLSMFPAVLLNKVSELYAYNMMPFVAAIFGGGLGDLLSRTRAPAIRAAAGLLGAGLAQSHFIAVRSKVHMMVQRGREATALLAAIRPYAAQVPSGGTLLLATPTTGQTEYSVFQMTGFNVLHAGLHRIPVEAGKDFSVMVVLRSELTAKQTAAESTVAVTVDPVTRQVHRID